MKTLSPSTACSRSRRNYPSKRPHVQAYSRLTPKNASGSYLIDQSRGRALKLERNCYRATTPGFDQCGFGQGLHVVVAPLYDDIWSKLRDQFERCVFVEARHVRNAGKRRQQGGAIGLRIQGPVSTLSQALDGVI